MTARRTVKTAALAFMIVLGLFVQFETNHTRQHEAKTVTEVKATAPSPFADS